VAVWLYAQFSDVTSFVSRTASLTTVDRFVGDEPLKFVRDFPHTGDGGDSTTRKRRSVSCRRRDRALCGVHGERRADGVTIVRIAVTPHYTQDAADINGASRRLAGSPWWPPQTRGWQGNGKSGNTAVTTVITVWTGKFSR